MSEPYPLRRRSLLLGAGALPLLAAAARAQSKPGSKPKPSGQVVIGISQEPTVFNPLLPHIEVDDGIYMSLFSPLWAVDPQGNFLPRLAMEIPSIDNGGVSADGLHWRIKLRDGVLFQDVGVAGPPGGDPSRQLQRRVLEVHLDQEGLKRDRDELAVGVGLGLGIGAWTRRSRPSPPSWPGPGSSRNICCRVKLIRTAPRSYVRLSAPARSSGATASPATTSP